MAREGKCDAECVLVSTDASLDEKALPGRVATWRGVGEASDRHGLSFGCPCGCGSMGSVSFGPGKWALTGELPRASVTPSIGFYGGPDGPKGPDGYHWHGYLTDGVFEEC